MTAVASTPLATGRWRHEPDGTTAAFTVRNLGVHRVPGTVPVAEAWVDVDASGAPARVGAVLDLRAIDTGHRKRDADLQKRHLLDTANTPTLEFTGTPTPADGGWQVTGRLAGRETVEVTLRAEVRPGEDGASLVVRATGALDRRALGVRAPRFMIGRRVLIDVTAAFRPPR
jgi:polyisoprenoid-binding protein YceI